jgi:hypothetical protein
MLTAAGGILNLLVNSFSATKVQQEPTSSMVVGTLKTRSHTSSKLQHKK